MVHEENLNISINYVSFQGTFDDNNFIIEHKLNVLPLFFSRLLYFFAKSFETDAALPSAVKRINF
jgi:hypothetical protein